MAFELTSLPACQAIAEYLMAQTMHETLTGGEWIVEDIAGGGVIDNTQASLSFSSDGRISGSATCNLLTGRYEGSNQNSPEEGSISFGALGMTRIACPEALENQEQKLVGVLNRVERFTIDATGTLLLSTADGEVVTAQRR